MAETRRKIKRRPARKTAKERAFEKINVRLELNNLESLLEQLKVEYEQYFLGIHLHPPNNLHKATMRLIRKIRKAPFKRPSMGFRLKGLEGRYHTYNDYWQRVLRQKEEGTYSKDLFKAELRERNALEDLQALTAKGKASKSMVDLFANYKRELEKHTGRQQNINFDAFQSSLVKRAKAYRKKHGGKKLSFKIVVKNGKVTVKAKTVKAKAKQEAL